MIRILTRCQKELDSFSLEVREDLADALARLEQGQTLIFPLCRAMPSIGNGVYELRLRDKGGIYRVIYVVIAKSNIWLLHAFKKKTLKTPIQSIELAKKRLKDIL